jgi:prephenate dehydrogenase
MKAGEKMNNIDVGIIGGTGGMGRWFGKILARQGCTVHVAGRTTGMSVPEMAAACEVVVVGVPIRATRTVIEQVGPHMRRDALLMDLTSLKADPVAAMLASSLSEVVGCHPLFGPQVESAAGHHVVLCPARTERWLTWLRDVFTREGALVVETSPDEHDALMGVVQVLNHLNTIAMGLVMAGLGRTMAELTPFTTPIFEAKGALLEKVFCHNPALYADIIALNPSSPAVSREYEKVLAQLGELVTAGDAPTLTALMEKAARLLFPPPTP